MKHTLISGSVRQEKPILVSWINKQRFSSHLHIKEAYFHNNKLFFTCTQPSNYSCTSNWGLDYGYNISKLSFKSTVKTFWSSNCNQTVCICQLGENSNLTRVFKLNTYAVAQKIKSNKTSMEQILNLSPQSWSQHSSKHS